MKSKTRQYRKNNPWHQCLFIQAAVVTFLLTGISSGKVTLHMTPPDVYPEEIVADWKDQDGSDYAQSIEKIKASIPLMYAEKITGTGESGYLNACHWRRIARLTLYSDELENIMFTRHHNFGGKQVGYHDNTDASASDPEWSSHSALCLMHMTDYYPSFNEIVTRTDGVVRDPCISFDGKKVLFAMSGKGRGTGYKIYEMDIDDPRTIRQLTHDPEGMVVADMEPCYLPNGDIAFTSTRNFGCGADGFSPVTNMFLMNGEGRYIRQVGFDQVHTFYPVLRDDGTVLYTRWEYNDREVTGCMGLFSMSPDGCHQTEWFGNQTSWPMTIIQARPIPGTRKVMAIAGGHLGPYSGEVMIVDPDKGINGFNGTECIRMIAPEREPKPAVSESDIGTGGSTFTFQTPYPLDEECFLVSWRKSESDKNYKLYFMDVDGNRELLAWAHQSVSQPVVVRPWKKIPPQLLEMANYNDSMGIFSIQDVYYGEGMKGVDKTSGCAKSIRVIKLHYRAMGAGWLGSTATGSAPVGTFGPTVLNPVSQYGASWDVKEVLGEATIHPDGSTSFKVPARTPVYFQVLDSAGLCIASMRSWSTLMPGEIFACTGCHENKTEAPPAGYNAQGLIFQQELETPLGIEKRPFDYQEMVQPIFEKHCVSCHTAGHSSGFDLRGDLVSDSASGKSWTRSYSSLLKGIGAESSNRALNINTIFSGAEQQSPYSFGSSRSGIMKVINGGLPAMKELQLTDKEKKIIACWIDLAAPHFGSYTATMSTADVSFYDSLEEKREKWATIEAENLRALAQIQSVITPDVRSSKNSSAYPEIRYVPTTHSLVFRRSRKGTFRLIDLKGRELYRKVLLPHQTERKMSVSLPDAIVKGLYIATLTDGGKCINQTRLSIIE